MNEIAIKGSRDNKGLELKIARLRAGLKQYELAAKVGIAPTQLCEIETGRREVPAELLERILRVISNRDAQQQV
jgi:transcriptional regulator with XRE-family HTH domain